jgi:hypothetical protein
MVQSNLDPCQPGSGVRASISNSRAYYVVKFNVCMYLSIPPSLPPSIHLYARPREPAARAAKAGDEAGEGGGVGGARTPPLSCGQETALLRSARRAHRRPGRAAGPGKGEDGAACRRSTRRGSRGRPVPGSSASLGGGMRAQERRGRHSQPRGAADGQSLAGRGPGRARQTAPPARGSSGEGPVIGPGPIAGRRRAPAVRRRPPTARRHSRSMTSTAPPPPPP